MILYRITPDNTPEVRRRGYDPGEAVAPDETEALSFDATVTGRLGTEVVRAERALEVVLLRAR
jgi:hypothetical protein